MGKSGDQLNFQDSRNPNNWLVEVKLEIFPKSGCFFLFHNQSRHFSFSQTAPWGCAPLPKLDVKHAFVSDCRLWLCISSWWFQPIWTNISEIGSSPQVGVKIKHIWNHHLDTIVVWTRLLVVNWFNTHQKCWFFMTKPKELSVSCNLGGAPGMGFFGIFSYHSRAEMNAQELKEWPELEKKSIILQWLHLGSLTVRPWKVTFPIGK